MNRLDGRRLGWGLVVLCLLAPRGLADVLNVPGDFPTIQGAIDAASDGDEIVVERGLYRERINLRGKAITLTGTDPGDPATVDATAISGSRQGTVVTCNSGEGRDTIIRGLTFGGGDAIQSGTLYGGAAYNDGSSPTYDRCHFYTSVAISGGGMANRNGASPLVTGCRFEANAAQLQGAGMLNDNSSPEVIDCVFTDLDGVAIHNASFSSPTITGCILAFSDGGVYNGGECNAELTDCVFARLSGRAVTNIGCSPIIANSTFYSNDGVNTGAAIYNQAADVLVLNCLFRDNEATQRGGAITNQSGSTAVVFGSVFNANTTLDELFGRGGAVYNSGGSDIALVNCTLAHNEAGDAGHAVYTNAATTMLVNSIVWDNAAGDAIVGGPTVARYCIIDAAFPGVGNTTADPLFANPRGSDRIAGSADDDLSLRPGSPAIDAGDGAALLADVLDLDGDGDLTEPVPLDLRGSARLRDDPDTADTGTGPAPVVDRGAYEFQPACAGDLTGDGLLDFFDVSAFLAAFGAGDPAADFNDDGLLNFFDVSAFLGAFAAGCD